MDTSKEYIEMCEKAEEIQGRELAITGDLYWSCGMVRMIVNCERHMKLYYTRESKYSIVQYGYIKHHIWLPRQDQLQAMIKEYDEAYGLIDAIHEYILTHEWKRMSMEQLWLAFVMKEKYQKTWNGKEWSNAKR